MARKVSLQDRQNKPPKASTLVLKSFTSESKENSEMEDKIERIKNNQEENETNYVTKNVEENVICNETKDQLEKETLKESKKSTKLEKKKDTSLQYIKKIKIGSTTIEGKFYADEELKRSAYHLRLDTINKIERCKKLAGGLKKAELVDLILNDALSKILNKLENEK